MALTAAEQAELAALEKGVGDAQPAAAGLTDAERAEMADLEKQFPPEAPGILDYAAKGLGAVGKAFDVGRGTTGGPALGALLEKKFGKKVFSKEDVKNAVNPTNLKGFPTTSEMLARAGVGEHGSLSDVAPGLFETPGGDKPDSWLVPNKGGLLDITGRGTMGLVGDIATDPATYLSGGVLALPKAAGKILPEALLPLTRALRRGGKRVYDSGLRPIAEAGEAFGKDVLDTYFKNGIRGTPERMSAMAEKISSELKGEADNIVKQAAEKGAKINVQEALQPHIDRINALVKEGGSLTPKEGEAIINDMFDRFVRGTEASPEEIVRWKENIYKGLPNSSFKEGARTPLEQGLDKQFASDLRNTSEKMTDGITSEKGLNLKETNRQRGDLLTTRKALDRMANQSAKKPNPFFPFPTSPSEWMLLLGGGGLGMMGDTAHGIGLGPSVVAAKRLTDMIRSPGVRTTVGYNLAKAMDNPAIAPIIEGGARRLLTNPGGYYGQLLKDEK